MSNEEMKARYEKLPEELKAKFQQAVKEMGISLPFLEQAKTSTPSSGDSQS